VLIILFDDTGLNTYIHTDKELLITRLGFNEIFTYKKISHTNFNVTKITVKAVGEKIINLI
jgi:hypothetical protein